MTARRQQIHRTRLGRAVRSLRAEQAMSQERLGLCSGLHRNYVGAIERGEINPTFRVLLQLSEGLEEQVGIHADRLGLHRAAFIREATQARIARGDARDEIRRLCERVDRLEATVTHALRARQRRP